MRMHERIMKKMLRPASLRVVSAGGPHGCAENRRVLVYNNFIALALLAATSLVAGFFAYIYSLKRQAYLLLWTAGWTLFALHYLGAALAQWVPDTPLQAARVRWLS